MRGCAKMRCGDSAVATVALRYEHREVLMADLLAEPDPNLIDLCSDHADGLTAPIGWNLRDERTPGHSELQPAPRPGDAGDPQMGSAPDLAGRTRE
ncbi:MAG: DUF3499 family protein [Actinomycetota bacterium]